LWQHVFQVVVCVLSAVQRATQSHAAIVGKKNSDVIKMHGTTIQKTHKNCLRGFILRSRGEEMIWEQRSWNYDIKIYRKETGYRWDLFMWLDRRTRRGPL